MAERFPLENLKVVGNSVYRVAPDGQMFFVRALAQDPTANTDVFAATPPRADAPSFYESTPDQGYFGEQAVGMAAPYLENARNLALSANTMTPDKDSYVPESIQRIGNYATNMGLAGLSAAMAPVYGAAGAVGDVAKAAGVPRSEALTRDLVAMLDTAGVLPEGRILGAMADAGAVPKVAGYLKNVGRAVVERANQPGPMPTVYSNPIPAPQNKWLQALSGQEVAAPTSLPPPPSTIFTPGVEFTQRPPQPYNPIGARAGTGPARPSDPKAEALGFKDTVYHSTLSPEEFTQFDLSKQITGGSGRSFQDYLGVHVGTAKAASDRNLGASQEARLVDPQGHTMELRARTDNPLTKEKVAEMFGVPVKRFFKNADGPFQEQDFELLQNEYANELLGTMPDLARKYDEYTIPRPLVAAYLRKDLADRGFTHIPYVNAVEDRGNTSLIMLTDRDGRSPAVLRDVRAGFDPNKIDDPDLRFSDGGSVKGSTLSDIDVFALQ